MLHNALRQESSLYLRSHATQPIHWQAWNSSTLQLAKQLGRPILLSIGYSSCHWCHVMAHEAFEDQAVADILNAQFLCIKVDREERPDVDKVYQLAHQLLSGRGGGWPLTVFCEPEALTPFFAGTYFPLTPRFGMPGFANLLNQINEVYHSQPDNIKTQCARLRTAIRDINNPLGTQSDNKTSNSLTDSVAVTTKSAAATISTSVNDGIQRSDLNNIHASLNEWLNSRFDNTYGGFGSAPKFPHTEQLEYLYNRYVSSIRAIEPDLNALYQLSLTLTRMAESGLCDQLAGGFFRYSVDAYWMIPHFEKMLYDNGLLLSLYAKVAHITGERLFIQTTRQLAHWLCNDFCDADGLFYASQDADSDGHEGCYYIWQPTELTQVLSGSDLAIFESRFGLNRPANFESTAWHLHAMIDRNALAQEFLLDVAEIDASLERSRTLMKNLRAQRNAPTIDQKRITSWNAMAIEGLIQASLALNEPAFLNKAQTALTVLDQWANQDGQWLSVRLNSDGGIGAYLDDVAYLLTASIASLQAEFRASDLKRCEQLAEMLVNQFSTPDGGFWFTSHTAEPLLDRPRSLHDEATPAAAAIAAVGLLRLGYLFGNSIWITAAERCLQSVIGVLRKHPAGLVSWLAPLEEYVKPPTVVIIRGSGAIIRSWQHAVMQTPQRSRLILTLPDENPDTHHLLPDKPTRAEGVVYVCDGLVCQSPITDMHTLIKGLELIDQARAKD